MTQARATSRNQGAENVGHRFMVCVEHDGHPIYAGYSSMQAALDFACEYTGGTLKFKEEDRKLERGRDMGKPTILYRVHADGQRVPWHNITRKGHDVVIKATAEYKQEQKEQGARNEAARENAQEAAAKTFETRKNDMTEMAGAIGAGIGDKLGEFIDALKDVQADGDKQEPKGT